MLRNGKGLVLDMTSPFTYYHLPLRTVGSRRFDGGDLDGGTGLDVLAVLLHAGCRATTMALTQNLVEDFVAVRVLLLGHYVLGLTHTAPYLSLLLTAF